MSQQTIVAHFRSRDSADEAREALIEESAVLAMAAWNRSEPADNA